MIVSKSARSALREHGSRPAQHQDGGCVTESRIYDYDVMTGSGSSGSGSDGGRGDDPPDGGGDK